MIAIRLLVVVSLIVGFGATMATADDLTPIEMLGKNLFFDANLSTPPGVSCAACHAPETGFTGPNAELNAHGSVYTGAVHVRFGNRKPPTSAYAGDSPPLYFDDAEEVFIGGMFWDGRATGWTLGDPLAEQAQGPFLNPLEQNNPNAALVCLKVAGSDYAYLYEEVYGEPVDFTLSVAQTYERIARAIAAYERSSEVNPFTSKYDYYLAGEAELTAQEAWGLELFEGKGKCSACHLSEPGPNGEPPLFTDFTYDNLGVPKNPENPFYTMPPKWNPAGADWIDLGLGGFLAGTEYAEMAEQNNGKQKVPTLRNVDKRPYPGFVKAYTHNGYFKTLEETVYFYNTRDVLPPCYDPFTPIEEALAQYCWPEPEVAINVNTDELGNLGLTPEEEAAIVAFMKTLTDGYMP